MALRNIKLREHTTSWFAAAHNRPQEIQNAIRALRRLSGYLPEKHNREELAAFADWLEDIRDHAIIPLHDQINRSEEP